MRKTLVIVPVLIVLVVAILSYFMISKPLDFDELQARLNKAYLIKQDGELGRDIPTVQLVGDEGEEFTLEQLRGKWSLVFFGFTYCPDICVTELHLLAKIMQALKKGGVIELPQVFLVSIDPKRDQAEKLHDYVRYFHPSFRGLTGEVDQLHRFMKPFGAYYEFTYNHGGKYYEVKNWQDIPQDYRESYTVNHTAWTYLVNPQAKLVAAFPSPHDGELMLEDIQLMLQNLL